MGVKKRKMEGGKEGEKEIKTKIKTQRQTSRERQSQGEFTRIPESISQKVLLNVKDLSDISTTRHPKEHLNSLYL